VLHIKKTTYSASYERHLIGDTLVHPATAGLRERFEAIAHAIRHELAERWFATGDRRFSSDRTISECAAGMWNIKPCPVE